MQDAGILEGDYVVVRRQQDARDGEIVVALAGDDESADEATVKRFFRDGPLAAASASSPRTTRTSRSTPHHVQILGKVTGCSARCDAT